MQILATFLTSPSANFDWNFRKYANMLMTGIIFLVTVAGPAARK